MKIYSDVFLHRVYRYKRDTKTWCESPRKSRVIGGATKNNVFKTKKFLLCSCAQFKAG